MGKDSPMYAVDKDEDICEFNDQYLLRAIPVEGYKLKELVLLLQQQSTPHIARGTMQCRFNFPHSTTSIAEPCPDPEARDKAHHLLSKVSKVYIYTYIYNIYIYIYIHTTTGRLTSKGQSPPYHPPSVCMDGVWRCMCE